MPNPRKKLLPLGVGRALDSIRVQDERGLLYFMDYRADYYKLEKYADLVTKPGCSTFLTKSPAGEAIFARNYDICHWRYNEHGDLKDVTGLILVVRCANRKAKYRSIGVVDAFWLDINKGRYFEGALSDGRIDVTLMAVAPLAIMDGINEEGLAVSIMHLPTENEWIPADYMEPDALTEKQKRTAIIYTESGQEPQRLDASVKKHAICINTADRRCWTVSKDFAVDQTAPGKKTMIHPILMRRMLDFCGTVDEAVELARSVNVKSPLRDNDYHILVSDKSGRSVILEWVNNEPIVAPATHGTNFYLTREDRYGYGYDRDEMVKKCMEEHPLMTEEEAMRALALCSQDGTVGRYEGVTQWSSLYNLHRGTMKLTLFSDFSKTYEYKL